MKLVWTIAAAVALAAFAAACNEDDDPSVSQGDATAEATEEPSDDPASAEAEETEDAEDTATAAPTEDAAGFGDTLTFDDGMTLTLHEFAAPVDSGNEFIEPDPGNVFLAIDVEQCAPTEDDQAYSAIFWEAGMPDNTRRSAELAGAMEPAYTGGDLTPGSCVRGWITFEVPDGVPPARIHFSDFTHQGEFVFDR